MTITTSPSRNEYTAGAAQTIFNYTFKIFTSTDLNVYVTPAGFDCDDTTDLTTAFTVVGIGLSEGGSITLTTPASAGDLITIVSNIPSNRTTDYQNNGDFLPNTVNDDFDRVVALSKQTEDVANRTLIFDQCTQNATQLTLPEPAASSLLRWKGDVSGLENIESASLPVGVITQEIPKTHSTNAAMAADTSLTPNQMVITQGKVSAGDDLGAIFLIVGPQSLDDGDVLLNNSNVGVFQGFAFKSVNIGVGVKGNPQTNVGVQVHRDITGEGTSTHGFNCADFFADDTQAHNPFGADIQIGDGTQTTEVLNHVNDFQSTDKINLGSATITNYRAYTNQSLLESGTMGSVFGFVAADVLGGRDTPGFSTPNFEVDGTATVGNQTGLSTLIRHGSNPRSIHCAAGNTDAGALLSSGGAPVDLECPVTIRQNTASTSKATGALVFTLGGIGCAGDVWADKFVASNASAEFSMNSAAGTQLGSLLSTASLTSLTNVNSGTLELGVSNTAEIRLLSDRFLPVTDNDLNLGDATHRWIQLFATTTTISTSDVNTKTNILKIDDDLLDAWENVQAVIFQFKDAVAEKGDNARLHAGYIAQQVQASLEANGIDGFRYALLCKDEIKHTVKKTRTLTRQKTEFVTKDVEVFERNDQGLLIRKITKETNENPITELMQIMNEDGTPYLDPTTGATVMHHAPVFEEYEEEYEEEELSGEFLMGLRYDQCMIVETAYLRREIARLKKN